MAEPTLKINNTSNAKIRVVSDDKKRTFDIDAGKSEELPRAALVSASFRDQLTAGKVTFSAARSDAERTLAVDVMRLLLGSLAPGLVSAARVMPEAKQSLADRRTAYNDAWTSTKAVLERGNGLQAGAKALSDAADLYLTPVAAQDAQKAAAKALADLDLAFVDDVKKNGLDDAKLQKYNADRKAALDALAKADAALKAATDAVAGEFGSIRKALAAAKDDLGKIKPADVGAKIAAW